MFSTLSQVQANYISKFANRQEIKYANLLFLCLNTFERKIGMKNIVDIVKNLANEHGESLASIERKLDFGNGTISRWRNNTPSVDKVEKVAAFFSVSTDYILGRTNTKTSPDGDNEFDINDDTVIMTLDGEELTESERQVILAATRALIEQRKKEGKK